MTWTLRSDEDGGTINIGLSYAEGRALVAYLDLIRAIGPGVDVNRNENLYNVAKDVCHQLGMTWTDPRTGTVYPPPPQCECRTAWCGHVAGAHNSDGTCVICNKESCWR